MSGEPPPGYTRSRAGAGAIVARADAADAVAEAVRRAGTLYAYAAAHPGARAFAGRAPAYGATLPNDSGRVVVRRSRHGGLLARLTGDRFVRPSRAPAELRAALRLAASGVPTPPVVAYVLYPAGPGLCRADVATGEIACARDLGELLADAAADPGDWVGPVSGLLAALSRAGAHHPDLNVKNVLLAVDPGAPRLTAYVLDVDRVRFPVDERTGVGRRNLARLVRSMRKRRARGLAHVTDATLAALAECAGGVAA